MTNVYEFHDMDARLVDDTLVLHDVPTDYIDIREPLTQEAWDTIDTTFGSNLNDLVNVGHEH